MSCEWFTERLSPLHDNELEASERAKVEAHLSGCSECAAQLRDLQEADALARAASPLPELPSDFMGRLERTIDRAPASSPAPPAVSQPSRSRMVWAFAAGVFVGAASVIAGMHHSETVAVPAQPSDVPLHRFVAASDLLVTDLTQLSGEDPERDLPLLREQVRELGLVDAIASVRSELPQLRATDPALAQEITLAVDGTESVATKILADSSEPAEVRLFATRDDAERIDLAPLVWGLCRGGLPRPPFTAATPVVALPTEPRAAYLAAVGLYAHGEVARAREGWERLLAAEPERPIAVRASYWAARSSLLEGRVQEAMRSLPSVATYCPDAILETPIGPALRAEMHVARTHGAFGVKQRAAPGEPFFVGFAHDGPRELRDVVVHLVKPGVEGPGPLREIREIRIDDQSLGVEGGEVAPLKVIGPIMARRLGGQGRCEVRREEGGIVTLRFRLEQARFQSPEGRKFVKVLSTAAGRPIADPEGNSKVGVVEVRGKVDP